ncbi:MAG TPA: FAD-dependent oxidoreductase [Planctomycetota bacterium]|nr:FAD-dependent oxidoreductase [Planctomycetota bacterium]
MIETLADTDVLVVGSGSAGSTAAIAAARAGARTLLLERYGFLGGTSTLVLDTFYGFYTPGSKSLKVVGGIPDDVVGELRKFSACFERPNTYGAGTGVTYHPDYLKVVWEKLARDAGVRVLLHAWVQDVETEGDRVSGVIVATKIGLRRIAAKIIVDASGDADVCYYSGVPFELAGEREPAQTLTTTFRMVNVDVAKRKSVPKARFHELLAAAAASGSYDLPRKEGSDHAMPVPGMTSTIMTRLQSFETRGGRVVNATDPELLSRAEMEGRRQALEYARFLRDRVPGYENADFAGFGVQIGIRETRRVEGEYRLTREDVLGARRFDDQIGLCGAPIEDHHGGADTKWQYLPDGQCVGIPYRTLLPRGKANLLVAGRCFSATHDAHASVRSMAQCMAMGQAAGSAAAMATQQSVSPKDIDVAALRDKLRAAGAAVESP